MVFVPLLLITGQGLATPVKVPTSVLSNLPIDSEYYNYVNLGVIAAIFYSLYYLSLDIIFGVISTPIMLYFSMMSTDFMDTKGSGGLKIFAAIHVVSWLVQFVGHGAFEHRAPALLDNLSQALLLAPMFVMFEFANLLGLRKGIMDQVDELVKPEIAKFRAQREKKKI